MTKKRLDQLLIEKGLATDSVHASKLIMAGEVYVSGQRDLKAGSLVDESCQIRMAEKSRYVGRGGEKLEAALAHFNVIPKNCVAIDIGASTGGFTDCLLQHGATKVYAVDVGSNELDWKLRTDHRVVNLTGVNGRELHKIDPKILLPRPTLAVVDVSFISITLILESLKNILPSSAQVLGLIKPQFELPKEQIEEGGVVKDPALHENACQKVRNFSMSVGFEFKGLYASPVKGLKKGNQEFFIFLSS